MFSTNSTEFTLVAIASRISRQVVAFLLGTGDARARFAWRGIHNPGAGVYFTRCTGITYRCYGRGLRTFCGTREEEAHRVWVRSCTLYKVKRTVLSVGSSWIQIRP